METIEYPFHKGARTSLYVVAALCIILVCAAPIGLFFIWRVSKGKVSIDSTRIRADGLMSDEIAFADVERLGILKIPLGGAGLGRALARLKLDNMDHGVNLVARLKSGKNVKFLLNQYERHGEIIEKVKQACPSVPMEEIPMGLLTWKWPEPAPLR
ncbi:MAG: hypothetical protein IPJ65_01165 [Archangiaceae bacterium]|nr:hypothetical protein [Archangiaceae bacterium]